MGDRPSQQAIQAKTERPNHAQMVEGEEDLESNTD
jgi:hypothetical protein